MLITRIWNGYWMTYRQSVKRGRPESAEQIDFIAWVRYHYPELDKLVFHPVNEGHQLPQHRLSLIKQGMESGVSDVIMLQCGARFPAGVIEIKRDDGGSVSKEQRKALIACNEQAKFSAVAHGAEAAKAAFMDYMIGLDDEAKAAIIHRPMRNAPAKLSLNEDLS